MIKRHFHTVKMKTAAFLMWVPLWIFLLFSCPVKRSMLSIFTPSQTASSPVSEMAGNRSALSFSDSNLQPCNKCIPTVKKEAVVSSVNLSPVTVAVKVIPGLQYNHYPGRFKSLFRSFIPQSVTPDGMYTYLKYQSLLI